MIVYQDYQCPSCAFSIRINDFYAITIASLECNGCECPMKVLPEAYKREIVTGDSGGAEAVKGYRIGFQYEGERKFYHCEYSMTLGGAIQSFMIYYGRIYDNRKLIQLEVELLENIEK